MEDYVSFEQAKALKELRFDWETWCFYSNNDNQLEASVTTVAWNKESNELSAPTLAQAAKWLREVKGMNKNDNPKDIDFIADNLLTRIKQWQDENNIS